MLLLLTCFSWTSKASKPFLCFGWESWFPMSAHLWVLCCSSAPCFSIAGHIEYVEHFRMSISYTLYYNKITRQWNMLNSHLNKCSSVKYILTYHLLVWKWRTIKSRQVCMEVSTNVNTFFQCLEKFDSFKKTLVWIHLAALPSFFFFPDHFWRTKKSFVWNEVCFTLSSCRSGLKNGLLGDQHVAGGSAALLGSVWGIHHSWFTVTSQNT